MNLQQLRYFVVLGEELHFRRAAARLHLSQPALSRAIQQLELALGFELLRRDNRNVSLTNAGQIYLGGCRVALSTLSAVTESASRTARGLQGEVRIGYTDIAVSGILPHLVHSFRAKYPDITISANHGCTQVQMDDLDADRLDVGFLTGPWSREGYETWEVQTDGFAAVLPERHPLAKKTPLRLNDLAEEPFILGEPRFWTHFHAHLQSICLDAGFTPKVVQHASNNEAILGLVACGMGVSVQAETIRRSQRSGVVIRMLSGDFPRIPTVAAWRPDPGNSAKMQLIQHVKEIYRTPQRPDAPTLSGDTTN